jgi:hypothetical protein
VGFRATWWGASSLALTNIRFDVIFRPTMWPASALDMYAFAQQSLVPDPLPTLPGSEQLRFCHSVLSGHQARFSAVHYCSLHG